MPTIKQIKHFFAQKPVLFLLIIALAPRLIAVLFAKGYGMHDDAFGPVQSMQELLDNWAIIYKDAPKLLLYPIAQYFSFGVCELLGIFDPQAKMYIVRLLHAMYSLLVVVLGYKIALEVSSPQTARKAGIVVALLWVLPYMSVRNLVELTVAPPAMAGVLFVMKSMRKEQWMRDIMLAGAFFGIAFAMRFQSGLFPVGAGLTLIYMRHIKQVSVLAIATIIVATALIAIPEYLIWNKPFGSLINYFGLQIGNYPKAPWYNTVGLIIGVLIPPMSVLLLFGYLRLCAGNEKHQAKLCLFLSVLVFLAFHAIYPFKQERFILTAVPMLAVGCACGWEEFATKSNWWQKHKRLLRGFWLWFWGINTALLVLFVFSYSKRTRVESFTYLSDKQVNAIVIELDETEIYFPPTFYLGKNRKKPLTILYKDYKKEDLISAKYNFPNYAIFFDERNLDKRTQTFEANYHCNLQQVKQIEAGLLDKLLHLTNPKHNKNYTAFIYAVKANQFLE